MSQKRLHQLEQHEKDMEDGITASDSDEEDVSPSPEEEASEKEAPDAGSEQEEDEKEEVASEAAAEDESSTAAPKRKRRKKKVFQPAELEAMSSRPSLWPLITAFSVAVLLAGAVSNRIVLGVGFVLILVSVIGWLRERR